MQVLSCTKGSEVLGLSQFSRHLLRINLAPREGKGYLLQYSGLENSMNCVVHGATKSQAQLSDFHFNFQPCPSYFSRYEKQSSK